ncbi:uncharacterized protein TA02670 [Theileria annulata]|uniref:Uncharacterized protein n=1 Tax=Theileria annulata TaxID=5874 RepID=Q4UD37_THEAN|nr:uncharacterized protein TA02670 [Theileria annulata]CAI75264.1 hypothetical protein TA02670 [Theileria annulata]|eukprot:XP_954740.1 hypothetical protein TA02670 [Theileria annulata]
MKRRERRRLQQSNSDSEDNEINFAKNLKKVEKSDLNNNEKENNTKLNGEVENLLANGTQGYHTQNINHNRTKYKSPPRNDYSRPAGLSSDRCMRDFMSAKNRKFYSNTDKMSKNSTPRSERSYNTDISDSMVNNSQRDRSVVINSSANKHLNNTVDIFNTNNSVDKKDCKQVEYIFRSNSILRNENRLRNTSHSDIFGAKELVHKRTLSYQSDHSTSELGSNIVEKRSKRNFKNHDIPTTVDSVNNENIHTNNSLENANESKDAENIVENVSLRLSGLKSETTEKDLETLCRCCKLQIVSITLDRNIITHCCIGTGRINLKSPRHNNLTNFKNLLKLNGFNFKS